MTEYLNKTLINIAKTDKVYIECFSLSPTEFPIIRGHRKSPNPSKVGPDETVLISLRTNFLALVQILEFLFVVVITKSWSLLQPELLHFRMVKYNIAFIQNRTYLVVGIDRNP